VSPLTIIETALLVVALVYIVALLRSHADILRRLAALEDGTARPGGSPPAMTTGTPLVAAADISGSTPAGDAVALSLGSGSPVTLLAFLTSGCASCAPLWEELRDPGRTRGLAERVVIVTHGTERESPSRLRALAPDGVDVVMAGAAWQDYAVPASPHFVLTDGAGGILGQGSALSWSQLSGMVADARADADAGSPDARPPDTGPTAGSPTAGSPTAGGPTAGGPPARTTAERAARSEQALARAGIEAGHPSLYPTDARPSRDRA
jgi:hypothetical protein